MKKVLILAFILLAVAAGIFFLLQPHWEVQPVTQKGPVIFFGDSLTVGVGADSNQDFPSLVVHQLNLSDAINAGVSGNTTQDALERLQKDVLDLKPSLVIVEFSGNDFLRSVRASQTIKNLDEISRRIHESGSALVLVEFRFPFSTDVYVNGFTEIGMKYKAAVVWNVLDGISGKKKLMFDDVHPNSAGYKIMAQRIAKPIKELLNKR